MAVIISMLRGVNLGSHHRLKMEELRALYVSLKLREAQSYVQSGNVIFRSEEKDLVALGRRIEAAIEKKFGFRPPVILRTTWSYGKRLRKIHLRNGGTLKRVSC